MNGLGVKSHEPDIDRLAVAMQRSRIVLRRYRTERREAVRQYVGKHWSEDGTREAVPVNLISLYVSIVGRKLVSQNPRVMLSTFDRDNKPAVASMQTWANKEIQRMKLVETLQRVTLDALFSIGICKVALSTPANAAALNWGLQAGQPFAERVDLDDFVFDVHARDFSEVSFIGHRYRVPLEVVRDSKLYTKARKTLTASTDDPYNVEGDERISTLGRGIYAGNSEEFEDYVDLWEVYLPRHKLVLTLADDHLSGATSTGTGGMGEALRTQKWIGPEHGPYHLLAFGRVPGNAMPKGPITDLIDLHDAANRLYRKLIRQAERQKEILAVAGGAMEDGSRIQEANDGDIIRNDNPERAQTRGFGGANQQNLAMAVHLADKFDFMAGNLAMLGGLAPQSKTLGQDQLLNQNSSGLMTDMQDCTVEMSASVIRALCWYWWHDPFTVMKSKLQLPGLPDMGIQRQVTPQQRMRSRFEDVEIEVDPYSMQHSTPQSRIAGLNQIVTQIITPMMQLLQQQGVSFDVNAYLTKVAAYMDMPDLADIVTIQEPPQQDGAPSGGGDSGPSTPGQTTRNYVRRSVGQDTPANRNADLMNMANAAPQNGQQQ